MESPFIHEKAGYLHVNGAQLRRAVNLIDWSRLQLNVKGIHMNVIAINIDVNAIHANVIGPSHSSAYGLT